MPTKIPREKIKKLQQPRVLRGSFPPKHSHPPPPQVQRLPQKTHQAEEDDIHEVVPFKSEPILSDLSYETTEVHEEYEDYSGYQEGAQVFIFCGLTTDYWHY